MLRLLQTFQLMDSNFPMGTFAQSFGLETAVQQGRIRTARDLHEYLGSLLVGSLAPLEAKAAWLLYRRLDAGSVPDEWLCRIDRVLTVQRMARESREGASKIGKRYLDMLTKLYELPALISYRDLIRGKRCSGHPALVHALAMHGLGTPCDEMALTYLYSALNAQVANGVRLIPLGQTDGQLILQRLFPLLLAEVERMAADPPQGEEDLHSAGVLSEIDAMAHERLYSRLFMS